MKCGSILHDCCITSFATEHVSHTIWLLLTCCDSVPGDGEGGGVGAGRNELLTAEHEGIRREYWKVRL